VPSPNVAEDHQTANARALTKRGAAAMIDDQEASKTLINKALEIIHDKDRLKELEKNSLQMARPDATEEIVNEILKLVKQ
jgi:UDP-N-acetylglucosamine--N-acetylmuramyl-(pentapeptide) pyrophosphoryl-undecaprenol N-acetylglucosamine transferase